MMSHAGTAFTEWQNLQKELHELERKIVQESFKSRSAHARGAGSGSLQAQAAILRERVDALFPAAMEELEAEVAKLSERRPRLQDQ
jgi:hypothetical protein